MRLRTVLDIVALMESTLPPYLYPLDMTHEHYASLLQALEMDSDKDRFEDMKGTIQKAIIEYFAKTLQIVDVEVTHKNFKLTKLYSDVKKDDVYNRILHNNAIKLVQIAENSDKYRVLPFLISLPSELRDELLNSLISSNITITEARKQTREQIETIFLLTEKDIILFTRGKISLRFYKPQDTFENRKDRRFNGHDPEKMEQLYRHYFQQGAWEYISEVLDDVLSDKLNFGTINNLYYRKNFIPVFRFMIEILLIDMISIDDREYVEGLTGYTLRQHFDQILYYTAENLLLFIEQRDKNAQEFIKDYTNDVIVDAHGKRVQKYAIIDLKEQTWNYSTIVSLVMQYKQVKARIVTQEEVIIATKMRLEETIEDMKAEKRSKEVSIARITEIEHIMAHDDIVYIKSKRNTNFLPESALTMSERRYKQQLAEIKMEKSNLILINKRIANKSIEITRRQKKVEHEESVLTNLKIQIVPIVETYDLMSHAVAKVLAKR